MGNAISSVPSTGNALASTPIQDTRVTRIGRVRRDDGDGDDPGVRRHEGHGHGRGRGPLQGALMQALQSLGLTLPPAGASGTTATTPSAPAGTSGSTDGAAAPVPAQPDTAAATPTDGNVRADIRHFMHALFQAIKGESSGDGAKESGQHGEQKSGMASGLSALISKVSNGTVPAELQAAFSKVLGDFGGSSASPSAGTATAPGTSAPQVTLQALLSKMQQNLGYGAVGSNAAIGNFVNEKG